jgi:multiple sugar transport system ATP-binding protein
VILGFRPEAGQLSDSGAIAAEVYATELYGAYTMLHLSIEDVVVHVRAERGIDYPIGATVRFDLDPEMMRFFDPETEAAITREMQ